MSCPLPLHPIPFSMPKSFWNDEGIPIEVCQSCETKSFRKKAWYSLLSIKIFCIRFFLKAERFPYQLSRCYETQKKFRENCDVTTPHPRPPLHDNFRHQKFLKDKCVPLRDLSLVWKKSSTVNGEILFWCIKFSIPDFFWNTELLNGYTTKFIGTMSHKKNRESPWCSPALLFEKIFDTSYFSNQRKTMIRFFTALWDEKLSTENRDTPILCMNFVRYPKIFETPKCSPMYIFTTVRQKFLTKP